MQNKTAIIVFLLILPQLSLLAKEVDLRTSLSVGAGYSDNIRLKATDERSSAYTRITPGIKISRQGARLKTDIDYNITGLFYASESDLNEVQHRLFATANSELIKNSIFLDLDATISQQLLDSKKSASLDGVSGSQNLTQTYTYGISPYWQKKWANYAVSTLRYNYDEVIYDGSTNGNINSNGGDDSTSNHYSLNVESGTKFVRYFWNFDYQYNDISYDSTRNRDSRSDAYKILLGYHYSKRLDYTFTTGYEDYKDGNSTTQRNDGGTGWRVGMIWNPNTRTNLTAEIGRRFFGRTLLLDFNHRSKRMTWHFKYDDSITDTRSQIINNNIAGNENPDGITPTLSSQFSAQFYLSRRLTADVVYQYSKSSYSVGLFNERRYYYDSDQNDEEDMGINFNWGLKIGKRTNMNTQIVFSKLDNKTGVNNGNGQKNTQDRTEFNWTLNRRLTPDMDGNITLSYRDNSADIKTYEYTEHAFFMNIIKRF